jgi:hypothetical protein
MDFWVCRSQRKMVSQDSCLRPPIERIFKLPHFSLALGDRFRYNLTSEKSVPVGKWRLGLPKVHTYKI